MKYAKKIAEEIVRKITIKLLVEGSEWHGEYAVIRADSVPIIKRILTDHAKKTRKESVKC
jgi:hypothetical protein